MVIVYTTFFLTHYYYLTVLIVPLTALMVRAYLERRRGIVGGLGRVVLAAVGLPGAADRRWPLGADGFVDALYQFAGVSAGRVAAARDGSVRICGAWDSIRESQAPRS